MGHSGRGSGGLERISRIAPRCGALHAPGPLVKRLGERPRAPLRAARGRSPHSVVVAVIRGIRPIRPDRVPCVPCSWLLHARRRAATPLVTRRALDHSPAMKIILALAALLAAAPIAPIAAQPPRAL